ncbi:MAG: hypothetical protein DRO87_03665 [Candidatus Thorarchaeota archaeon]|nr:MAG: hypothetical protein DRP09_01215 [Candidatus Thorarchaeota archaeon]RLI59168.1 MAG: hypothetical protein DRO87_03665 [Candidatus Thorarchaeota archaeon]
MNEELFLVQSGLKEFNVVIKDSSKIDVRFGYCYPSTYRSGMTGLALHILYWTLNLREDTSCERYFRHQTVGPANSVETGRALRDNHIVGFTLTYEEDVLNLLQMLRAGNVSVLVSERRDDDPIVIVGGPVVTANPEPYVDFVDAFVIGEGDLLIHDIVDVVRDSESRQSAIELMSELEGVYVPISNPKTVRRIHVQDLDSLEYPLAQVVPDLPEGSRLTPVFGKSFLLEVTRGCGHSCRFCLVGHVCRPRRTRSLHRLQELVESGMKQTPVHKVSLIGSSLGDLDRLEELVCWIVDQGYEVSVPSLRADSVTRHLLDCLVEGGQRTFTIAPETGSEELRTTLGKGLDDESILDAVQMAGDAGYRSIKLYFIMGLPGETDRDLDQTATMIREIAATSGLRVTASVNPFIPKAQTRWEREPQQPIDSLRRRLRRIQEGVKGTRVTIETYDLRSARIQAALSTGDRSLGSVILKAAEYGGYGGWRRAARETGIPILDMASAPSHLSHGLPWGFLE